MAKPRSDALNRALVKYRKVHPEVSTFSSLRSRSRKQNIPCDLTLEDIRNMQLPDRCPILDIPIVRSGARSDNSPSLDRIVPSKGYVKGNVHYISDRANRIKNDATLDELVAICLFIANYQVGNS